MLVMSSQETDCHMPYGNENTKSTTKKLLACLRLKAFSKVGKRALIIIAILEFKKKSCMETVFTDYTEKTASKIAATICTMFTITRDSCHRMNISL